MATEAMLCGTLRGERRHRRAGEKPCDACLKARRAYDRGRYVKRGPEPEPEPCGTDGAYQRHLRAKEKACDACRAAHAERHRADRAAAAAARDEFNAMLAEAWAEVTTA